MAKITKQTEKEIIKSAAYGYSVKKIAEIYGITEDFTKSVINSNKEEIASQKKYLAEVGK
jgi:DNA-binding CsgD family transcriptional regulator